MIFLVVFVSLFISPHGFSKVLPRGSSSGPGTNFQLERMLDDKPICHKYLWGAESGDIYFDKDQNSAFFLGHIPRKGSQEQRARLLQLELSSLTTKSLATLTLGRMVKLVGHGNPPTAISLVSFRGEDLGCSQGNADGVAIQWIGTKQTVKTFDLQYYKFLPTDRGVKVFEAKSRSVSDFDFSNFQSRSLKTLPSEGLPLYLSFKHKLSFHYNPEENGSLLKFSSDSHELEAKIKLAPGMKLVQQGKDFGVSKKIDENTLIVNRLRGWSGSIDESYSFKLSKLKLEQAKLLMDFDTGIGIFAPRSESLARSALPIEIIDGRAQLVLKKIDPPRGYFWSSVALSSANDQAVLLARNLKDYSLGAISIFDLKSKNLLKVHISL